MKSGEIVMNWRIRLLKTNTSLGAVCESVGVYPSTMTVWANNDGHMPEIELLKKSGIGERRLLEIAGKIEGWSNRNTRIFHWLKIEVAVMDAEKDAFLALPDSAFTSEV